MACGDIPPSHTHTFYPGVHPGEVRFQVWGAKPDQWGEAVNHEPIDLRAAGQFPRRFIHNIEMTFFLRDMHVHTRTHSSLCRPPHLSVLDTHTDK